MATATPSQPVPAGPSATGRGGFVLPAAWVRRHPKLASQLRGFAVVAIICTVISMAIFAGLRPLYGTQWANAISLVLCSVLNTELNRRISFGIRDRHLWWRDQRRGLWVMLLALSMTGGSLWVLHHAAPEASIVTELAVIVLGNVASAITRFVLLRYWIFRRVRHAGAAHPKDAPVPAHS